jgi:hypothetical protein
MMAITTVTACENKSQSRFMPISIQVGTSPMGALCRIRCCQNAINLD